METVILQLIVCFSIAFVISVYRIKAYDKKKEREEQEIEALIKFGDKIVAPSTVLIIEGIYLHTDEYNNKTIRNKQNQVLIEAALERIIYDKENHCLICHQYDRKGLWLYYVSDQKKVFRPYNYIGLPSAYMRYRTYGYNNRIGILNKDYTELTKAKYSNIRMIWGDYFLADINKVDFAEQVLIDLRGVEILNNIEYIYSEHRINDTILLKDLQGGYLLFNLSDYSKRYLPYYWIWLCRVPTGKGSETKVVADLILAMKETEETFEGYTIKKPKGTVLNAEGKELFPPEYDSIAFVEKEHLLHFEVGTGDLFLWKELAEDFEHFDGSRFAPMLYGIIDLKGQTIIPIEYTKISLIKDQFYKVNQGARLSFEVDYGGYAYDEPFWCWFVEGGKYGLYDLKGNLLLPVAYDDIYEVPAGSKGDIALVTEDKIQFMSIEGDRLVPIY